MCSQPLRPIEIADEVCHCQLGFDDDDAGIEGVTHQMLRRTCSTYNGPDHKREGRAGPPPAHEREDHTGTLHQIGAESVRVAVESLDQLLKKRPSRGSETLAH